MRDATIEYERVEVTLRDGTRVLGKLYKTDNSADRLNEWVPLTYSNRTQAERSAKREGGYVIRRGRPFYVRLPESEHQPQ